MLRVQVIGVNFEMVSLCYVWILDLGGENTKGKDFLVIQKI